MSNNTLIGHSELILEGKKNFTAHIDSASSSVTTYANLVGVIGTELEVCLEFALMAPPFSVSGEDSTKISVPVVARVLLPKSVAHKLIEAMQNNFKTIEDDAKNA